MTDTPSRPIVSSAHLAEDSAGLSEFEYGLIVAGNAFQRWIVRCMAAAGAPDLSPTDVMVLHHVTHRDRPKRLADLCFVLNIEDTHVVNYALKKLVAQGWVVRERRGKEAYYATTADGDALIARYRTVREDCLVAASAALGEAQGTALPETARRLRALSGLYDQAARAATSY